MPNLQLLPGDGGDDDGGARRGSARLRGGDQPAAGTGGAGFSSGGGVGGSASSSGGGGVESTGCAGRRAGSSADTSSALQWTALAEVPAMAKTVNTNTREAHQSLMASAAVSSRPSGGGMPLSFSRWCIVRARRPRWAVSARHVRVVL